jgi:hypothetical protein
MLKISATVSIFGARVSGGLPLMDIRKPLEGIKARRLSPQVRRFWANLPVGH